MGDASLRDSVHQNLNLCSPEKTRERRKRTERENIHRPNAPSSDQLVRQNFHRFRGEFHEPIIGGSHLVAVQHPERQAGIIPKTRRETVSSPPANRAERKRRRTRGGSSENPSWVWSSSERNLSTVRPGSVRTSLSIQLRSLSPEFSSGASFCPPRP